MLALLSWRDPTCLFSDICISKLVGVVVLHHVGSGGCRNGETGRCERGVAGVCGGGVHDEWAMYLDAQGNHIFSVSVDNKY